MEQEIVTALSARNKKRMAYRSPLWRHLEELNRWRMEEQTWAWICGELQGRYGIEVTVQGVQRFYSRAVANEKRYRPLGFRGWPFVVVKVNGHGNDGSTIVAQ